MSGESQITQLSTMLRGNWYVAWTILTVGLIVLSSYAPRAAVLFAGIALLGFLFARK